MQASTDRIRRVAEKHPELRTHCPEGAEGDHNHMYLIKNHRMTKCCAGTGWTPLPVSLWADALFKAGKGTLISRYWSNGMPWVLIHYGGDEYIEQTDNADDALVLALEQAS